MVQIGRAPPPSRANSVTSHQILDPPRGTSLQSIAPIQGIPDPGTSSLKTRSRTRGYHLCLRLNTKFRMYQYCALNKSFISLSHRNVPKHPLLGLMFLIQLPLPMPFSKENILPTAWASYFCINISVLIQVFNINTANIIGERDRNI